MIIWVALLGFQMSHRVPITPFDFEKEDNPNTFIKRLSQIESSGDLLYIRDQSSPVIIEKGGTKACAVSFKSGRPESSRIRRQSATKSTERAAFSFSHSPTAELFSAVRFAKACSMPNCLVADSSSFVTAP